MSLGEFENTRVFKAAMAQTIINWVFRFPETEKYLRKWIIGPGIEGTEIEDTKTAAYVTDQAFRDWAACGNEIDGFAEFCLLCLPTSEALFASGRCVVHAAAVRFRGKAFLIAAKSGVGKTTQVKTLLELYPDEIEVINGDKPILECRDDGTVIVHPSPWTGKEGLHGGEAAELGGIFLLRRGEENTVEPLSPDKAAPAFFSNIFQSYENGDVIRQAAGIAERVLSSSPVWLMTNQDVPDSTRQMYETMCRKA